MLESYTTIEGTAEAAIVEKKSEFIAAASFVDTEQAALRFLEEVRARHRTANHNVYAYLLRQGGRTRYSDDGEPQKTAGLPVLEVLRHSGLTDLIVVVTRYFGGTLLGTGGLVRAYSGAVQEGLRSSVILTRQSGVRLEIRTDYTDLGKIQYLMGQEQIPTLASDYTDSVYLEALVPVRQLESFCNALTEGTAGKVSLTKGDPCDYALNGGELLLLDKGEPV